MPPIPLTRYLVPEPPAAPAAALSPGFTLIDSVITGGLPHRLPLEAGLTLVLTLPTGLGREWLQADGHAIVSDADREQAPRLDPEAPNAITELPPAGARLTLRGADGTLLGIAPLALGVRYLLGDGAAEEAGDSQAGGVRIELVVLGWSLRAGNARGPGDWGGRITLAWRRADRGSDRFEPPALHPYVIPRLPAWQRRASEPARRLQTPQYEARPVEPVSETRTIVERRRHQQARARWRTRRRKSRGETP